MACLAKDLGETESNTAQLTIVSAKSLLCSVVGLPVRSGPCALPEDYPRGEGIVPGSGRSAVAGSSADTQCVPNLASKSLCYQDPSFRLVPYPRPQSWLRPQPS